MATLGVSIILFILVPSNYQIFNLSPVFFSDIWKLGRDFDIPVAKLIGSGQVVNLGDFANQVLNCAETWSLDRLALHLVSKP